MPITKKNISDTHYLETIGRRKSATARVRFYTNETLDITVNDEKLEDYFPISYLVKVVKEPFTAEEVDSNYRLTVQVKGGGNTAQAEAIRLGISRALAELHEDARTALKKAGFLKRDPRVKERKKPGLRKARRAPQWSKR